jgi:hypothetical protein
MAIFFRAASADNNPSPSASDHVSVPAPVGVQDLDLILVGISVPTPNVVVTPPDGWDLVAQSDPSAAESVRVYSRFAANEGARWVFQLSSSVAVSAACLVFGGVDGFEPVDASASASATSTASQPVPGVTPSGGGDAVAYFVGIDSAAAITSAPGLEEVLKTNGTASSLSARLSLLSGSAPVAAGTAALSAAADGAAVAVALRPSVGKLSVDDVRRRIVGGFPRGVDKVYDLEPGGDYYNLFQSLARFFKATVYDLVDLLNLEIVPYLARYKLPDWERLLGLTQTLTAQLGTTPQRQSQVLSAWRAAAGQGATFSDVIAAVGAALGYFPTTPVQILEADRSALDLLHTYEFPAVTVANGVTTTVQVYVNDGGVVSQAGARLRLEVVSGGGAFAATLASPSGGPSKTYSLDTSDPLSWLYGIEFAGGPITGWWELTIQNNSGGSLTLLEAVLVEGIGPRQNTGGAVFHWGAYADPAHMGESGVPADLRAALFAVKKLTFAHCFGCLLQSLEPWPGELAGLHCAIPGQCIPV